MLSPASPVLVDPQTGVQTRSSPARRRLPPSRLFHDVRQALFPCGIQFGKPQAEQAEPGVDHLGGQIDAGPARRLMQDQRTRLSLADEFADTIIYPHQCPVQGNILDMTGETLVLIQQHPIGHKDDPS